MQGLMVLKEYVFWEFLTVQFLTELIQKCGSWADDTANGKCNKASEPVTGEDWSALLQAKKQDFTAQ